MMNYEMSETCGIVYCPTTMIRPIDNPEPQQKKRRSSNFRLYFSVFVVNLLAFSTGAAYAWSSTAVPILTSNDYQKNPFGRPASVLEVSLITSLISLGASVGTLLASYCSDKFGRKRTLFFFALPALISHLITAFASEPIVFYVARFMVGSVVGCSYAVIPIYVGEIAETKNRGALGCIMAIMICSGMATVYIVGPLINLKMLSFILMVPLAVFLIFCQLCVPESPYYYRAKDEIKSAEMSLRKLRKNNSIEMEMLEIHESIENSKHTNSLCVALKSKSFRKGIIITAFLMAFQQFVGMTIIVSYMETIFAATESSISSTDSTVIVAYIQTIVVAVSSFLVDRWGRRKLLLISCTGVALTLLSMSAFFSMKNAEMDVTYLWWLPVTSLILYSVTYNFGMGPLPLVLLGELFSSNTKAVASSMTALTCLLLAFMMTFIFPSLKELIGFHGVFWLFSASAVLCLLFVICFVPETKGKKFQDILKILEQ